MKIWRRIKNLPKSAKTVQQIFQDAQKSSEKLRQKSPPQIQSAISDGASFSILKLILVAAGIIFLLSQIDVDSIIVFIFVLAMVIQFIINLD